VRSLSARLLISVSILLLIALSLTAVILDSIFRNAAIEATTERLNTQLVLLMSSADINAQGQLEMPVLIPEARFMTPESGLLGFVHDENKSLWKSDSAVGIVLPDLPINNVPENVLQQHTYDDLEYFQSSMAVEWEVSENTYQTFLFTVAENQAPFHAQLNAFRTRMFSWFAFLIIGVVLAQAMLMRKILSPLRKIAHEVSEIDQGQRELLSNEYPSELLGVTTNTNALLKAERSRMQRYRNTLGNLAHSLKTPLAVIQTASEKSNIDKSVIQNQVNNMNDIVGYQLKRAAAAGQSTLGHEPVAVAPLAGDIIKALEKVYFDKNIQYTNKLQDNLLFYGDRGDLTEVLGNLLDNAAKWANTQVSISAQILEPEKKRPWLQITIEDDGSGIAATEMARILKRGQRADETTPGHGIGLSVVTEIAQSYHGSLEIGKSSLGGAAFILQIPAI